MRQLRHVVCIMGPPRLGADNSKIVLSIVQLVWQRWSWICATSGTFETAEPLPALPASKSRLLRSIEHI